MGDVMLRLCRGLWCRLCRQLPFLSNAHIVTPLLPTLHDGTGSEDEFKGLLAIDGTIQLLAISVKSAVVVDLQLISTPTLPTVRIAVLRSMFHTDPKAGIGRKIPLAFASAVLFQLVLPSPLPALPLALSQAESRLSLPLPL